ncbi:hypothetical protein C6A85_84510 [Mycobacterium sp. ITM-2017-0098]|nr:hypothetical protein C6A85_84510 [Mycobacterium sp. ITM-2017-0098]
MGVLRLGALAFALLALVAGGLQIAAFLTNGWVRHAIVGGFAVAVGCSVIGAVVASVVRSRR